MEDVHHTKSVSTVSNGYVGCYDLVIVVSGARVSASAKVEPRDPQAE